MGRSLAGTRIRERRRALGLTQTALAEAAGISPSYLNLIEHNRRGIAGRVLVAVARALDLPPAQLAEGAESALVNELREIAAQMPEHGPEEAGIEEMIGRFPGWSRTLSAQMRRIRDQDRAIAALTDRLTHDPFLQESLHLMLSNITAIRSTSNILETMDDIPEEMQSRFHTNIHAESVRLSEAAQSLTAYFDRAADTGSDAVTADEEIDRFLSGQDHHFPTLDAAAEAGGDGILARTALLDEVAGGPDSQVRVAVGRVLDRYFKDARAMPLDRFAEAAADLDYDPAALATAFGADLHATFRRLATLRRPGIDAPAFGLFIVNAAGHALYRRPVAGFAMPRHGNACPLLPIFQSLAQPARALRRRIALPSGQTFDSFAATIDLAAPGFDRPPVLEAAMLLRAVEAGDRSGAGGPPPDPVGPGCRVCPRADCAARAEPQLLDPRTA
ncbi:XRE family transcriptional regulator [Oceanomicrobium pacificus]|uniref:DUF2083 domain-containing protein n=1 Tax=Oceanomicrobium pacificus TaxID=2692916 RepID=A0A6B0TUH8_9RHOB|nr:XRE family transcriptional regulator [Oceanomicrobium pacificus]MXU64902.1 DUF2083 domain-containing protein [Oceanomicrobium pacificus]